MKSSSRKKSSACNTSRPVAQFAIQGEAKVRHTGFFRDKINARSLPLGIDIARGSRYMPYAILRQHFLALGNWGLWRANSEPQAYKIDRTLRRPFDPIPFPGRASHM